MKLKTMTRIFLYLLLCFFTSKSSGQNFEISGGVNRNKFGDFHREVGHFISDYTPDYGYSFGMSISNFKIDTLPMRLSLRIDNYKGKFYTTSGGRGGAQKTEAEIEKTTIGLGFYPVNFAILKKIELGIGGELSFKINDKTTGYKSSWSMGAPGTYMTIENDSVKINKNFFWGFSGRISYDLKINETWFVSPQYKYHLGWSDEFKNTEAKIKSLRHNFEIGIIRRIG